MVKTSQVVERFLAASSGYNVMYPTRRRGQVAWKRVAKNFPTLEEAIGEARLHAGGVVWHDGKKMWPEGT